MKLTRSALLLAAAAATSLLACGDEPDPCRECADIAGTYRIDVANLSGECSFTPVVLGTQLALLQSEAGTEVSFMVADPASRSELFLSATVYDPEDGEEVLASFSGTQQLVRPATIQGGETLGLQLTVSGSVSLDEGRRNVAGSIVTTTIDPKVEPCTMVLTFAGRAAPAFVE